MSHVQPTGRDLTYRSDEAARSFVPEPAVVAEPERPSRAGLLAAFASAVARALRADPSSHQHWRRQRHDYGCQCGGCARWRHVERHGPRGRRGGGEI
jgi:hypothetical protein